MTITTASVIRLALLGLIGGLVQLTVRMRPAQKARMGRNPATGEEIEIGPKPASVALGARALSKAKGALPSMQKAKRKLG